LRKSLPGAYDNLVHIEKLLERHYRDMQQIEFTIQNGALYILETYSGKRTARASVKVAVAMVEEGLITERDALLRIDPELMTYFLYPMIDPAVAATGIQTQLFMDLILTILGLVGLTSSRSLGQGLPAAGGAVTGIICFSVEDFVELSKQSLSVIYCCNSCNCNEIQSLKVRNLILNSFRNV